MQEKLRAAMGGIMAELKVRGMRATADSLERKLTAEGTTDEQLQTAVELGVNELRRHGLEALAVKVEVELGWREAPAVVEEPQPGPGGKALTVELQEGAAAGEEVELASSGAAVEVVVDPKAPEGEGKDVEGIEDNGAALDEGHKEEDPETPPPAE